VTDTIAASAAQKLAITTAGTTDQTNSGAFTISNPFTTTNSATLTLSGNGSGLVTLSGAIGQKNGGSPMAVTKTGTSTFVFAADNSYKGTTTISGGTLQIGNGGLTGTIGDGSGAVVDNATLSFNHSNSFTVANAISGTGVLNQIGTGTTILTGTNTYGGTTTISAGTLQIGAGAGQGTLGTGSVTDNAALSFDKSSSLTVANAISGTGTLSQIGTGITILTGANTYMGTTTISGGTLQIGNAGVTGTLGTGAVIDDAALLFRRSDTVTVANDISGSGTLSKNGGTTILTGTNSYTGTTTVTAGTLQIGNGGTTGTLGTGGGVVLTAVGSALTFNRSNGLTVGNLISGLGTVSQNGTGTTTLTGNNTYTGTTTVTAGTLLINGNQSAATGAVTVNSGGTLGGTGTIGGTVTVLGGGNLSPGNSPGILNTGSVTLNATSNFKIDINGPTVGTQYDQLNVTGTVTITGSNLVITVGATLLRGQMFTIINNDSNDAVVGTFAGLTEGSTFSSGGEKFTITYVGGTGNDVVLAVAPEPSTWIGGALAVAALAYLQRRRLAGLLKRKLA
jgi:autotransporter-associated beta strand protein